MRPNPIPTRERLEQLFQYDPETGDLIRKSRPGTTRAIATFNSRCAGKPARNRQKEYFVVRADGRRYFVHRIAWKMMTGEEPPEIDHIDRNRGNNRWRNLRAATHQMNMTNSKIRKDNRLGIAGVCLNKKRGVYQVELCRHGVRKFLGYFNTPEEASAAYQTAKTKADLQL